MLTNNQKQLIINGLSRFHPLKIGVFGSFARNENTPTSDLDLWVQFEKKVNLLDIIGIELDLTEQLGIKVDLVTDASIHPKIRPYIEKDLMLIAGD